LRLRSPWRHRQYWSNRCELHKSEANRARRLWTRWTVGIIFIAAFVGTVLFTGVGEWLNHRIDSALGLPPIDHYQQFVFLAGFLKKGIIFGTFLGISIWWLRQLLRELRSHEHLAEDAAERVTMIETYAALKGAGLDAGDLTPILNALYRTAATGLVTDDTGGPVLPTEVFIKGATEAIRPR
jgi:hypothetical protein